MPKATDIRDCQRFADAIASVGGAVPDVLANLLSAYQVLSTPVATQRPETDILTHVLDGTLDQKMLDKLLPAAATAAMANTYRQELARSAEHTLVGQFHRELDASAANQILNSLRHRYDECAEALAVARSLFTAESTPEHVLASAEPKAIEAWQTLDGHLRVVTKIAAVASQFGPRLGSFSRVTEFSLGENARLDDRAIMCTDGPLVVDSALFGRPDTGHRSSPWFRVGSLRLHSIAEAQSRYDAWASEEFDRVHSGPRGGWIDQNGQVHQHPAPKNPYRTKASV
jgi:hypothetical protein